MKLEVLGSSSKGNCYLIHNDNEALMIEAGVPFEKVLQVLEGSISDLKGCLITHEHKDHAGFVKDVLNYAVPVYATKGTIKGFGRLKAITRPRVFDEADGCLFGVEQCRWNPLVIGNFTIIPFATIHDANEPCGFYINHPDSGAFLFATDTAYIPNLFGELRNILIECNYSDELLEGRKDIPDSLKKRISQSHMSVGTCIDALRANDLSQVCKIILIHISEGDGNPIEFQRRVADAIPDKEILVAAPGLSIDFNKTPF